MSDSGEADVEYDLEDFQIGEFRLILTTVAYMPIEKLMVNRAEDKEISGQKLWCGSLSIVEYISKRTELLEDSLVVELGAGTGALGMICKKLGAKSLILTDNDQVSITHMKEDAIRNSVDAHIASLDWFIPDLSCLNIRSYPEHNVRIVAGDVLYKNILLEPFFNTVSMIFSEFIGKNVSMLLCHVPRAGVTQEMVKLAATSKGLNIVEIPVEQWKNSELLNYCPQEDIDGANLYDISKSVIG